MFLILVGAFVGIILGAVIRRSMITFGVIGAAVGLVGFAVVASSAPRPKVPCWTESKGSEIFRAMPFFCTAQKQ